MTEELTGTEKQVAWADQIIEAARPSFTEQVKSSIQGPLFKAHPEWRADQLKAYEQAWSSHTDASWWIEHRDTAIAALIREGNALFKQMHP